MVILVDKTLTLMESCSYVTHFISMSHSVLMSIQTQDPPLDRIIFTFIKKQDVLC
ncbi:hypothetical protein ABH953_005598 [Bacillus sp. RC236]